MPTPSFTPGQRVTLQRINRGNGATPTTIDEVVVDVVSWLPEFNLLEAHENSRFTFIKGYRDSGRDIGARNPYGDDGSWREHCFHPGGRNAYIIAADYGSPDGDWVVVAQPPEAEPALPVDQPEALMPASSSRLQSAPHADLVSALAGIHELLDGQQCSSDTIVSIIEILQDRLGLEIRDPFHASEPPTA